MQDSVLTDFGIVGATGRSWVQVHDIEGEHYRKAASVDDDLGREKTNENQGGVRRRTWGGGNGNGDDGYNSYFNFFGR